MAQVKKKAVREAILAAALRLFRNRGYVETALRDIAAAAKTSRANIYVYFPSKFALFNAVFEPWLQQRLGAVERELTNIGEPRARLRRILVALWREIPSEGNGFANNLMQALSTASSDERYSPELLHNVELRVAQMIGTCLPANSPVDSKAIAKLAFMAFDGFAMHAHLKTGEQCGESVVATMCSLLLSEQQLTTRDKLVSLPGAGDTG
jgi:AcrR family transcriptional regulator